MLNWLQEVDTSLFLWLNGLHHPTMDIVMEWITYKQHWYPFYAILLAWLIWKEKMQAVWPIVVIILSIIAADQICSSVLKPLVARPRPCYEPTVQAFVHLTGGCGGTYGFASSHAANSFALIVVLYFFFQKTNKIVKYLFIWAIIVSYSRIYVGVHYPLDVLAGAGIGTLVASLIYNLSQKLKLKL